MNRRPGQLECLSLTVPEHALEAYEAALGSVCETVAFFRDHASATWRLEGVRVMSAKDNELTGALALAAAVTGVTAVAERTPTRRTDGWNEPVPPFRSS